MKIKSAFAMAALAVTAGWAAIPAHAWSDTSIVYFEPGSSVLSAQADFTLRARAAQYRALQSVEDPVIVIAGHSDRGSDGQNPALSCDRAEAVRVHLIQVGVPENRIATQAFGEARPAIDAENEAAQPDNRRAELTWALPTGQPARCAQAIG